MNFRGGSIPANADAYDKHKTAYEQIVEAAKKLKQPEYTIRFDIASGLHCTTNFAKLLKKRFPKAYKDAPVIYQGVPVRVYTKAEWKAVGRMLGIDVSDKEWILQR